MADPVGTISGLTSGIQWRDMVDQIMRIEQQRRYDPVAAKQTALKARASAWQQFQSVAAKFRDAAAALQQSTPFNLFSASANKSATSSRDLVSVTAGAGAVPGTYGVEVLASARAEKIGGAVVADTAVALGITGGFVLNRSTINIANTDSLVAIRNKINAANSGTSPSGVSATILAATGGSQLVLTAGSTGASGIEFADAGDGTLSALGFADGTTFTNFSLEGRAQTQRFSSSATAIGTLVGIALPATATIKAGGQSIAVDFATDSLESIAASINAATGNATAATVVRETISGKTYYRLQTDAAVEVDASVSASDSARALAALGFTRQGRSDVAQTIVSANTFADAATGLAATNATLATDLQTNGQSLGIVAGDTITIGGTRGDGTTVTRTLTITPATTLQDLLVSMNDATSGFGAGTRTAMASIVGGRITMADQTAGSSQLATQLTVSHAAGGAVTLGAFTTTGGTAGFSRQIVAGADAVVRVDGQTVRRSTNVISDAIAGVTLTALSAEPGTTVQVSVAHNEDGNVKSLQDLASAYNAVRSFVATATAPKGPLANSGALRSMSATLTSALLRPLNEIDGGATAARVGLQHDRNGVLSLNMETFKQSLRTNFDDVQRLFAQTGTATDSEVSFITAGNRAVPNSTAPYAVNITQAATVASVTGASWTTYATTGAPDTMTVNDVATGASTSVTLANGDSIALTVQKLNALFAAKSMHLIAKRTVDDRMEIASTDFGSTGGFGIAFTAGAGGDGTAMLGISAQSYAGLDVAGTIDGKAATGRGRQLTGATGTEMEGLVIEFAGTSARAAGTMTWSTGVGGALARAADALAATGTGSADVQRTTVDASARALDARLADIEARLESRRNALTRQFIAMESAMAKAQAIGGALTAQINALSSNNNN